MKTTECSSGSGEESCSLAGKAVCFSVHVCLPVTTDFSARFTFACSEIGVVCKYFCPRVVCSSARLDSRVASG